MPLIPTFQLHLNGACARAGRAARPDGRQGGRGFGQGAGGEGRGRYPAACRCSCRACRSRRTLREEFGHVGFRRDPSA
jgi:hypothetical protein